MMLAEHFAINMARELEMEVFSGFTEKAKRTLLEYEWPGNIRELKNVVERAVYRANNPDIPVHNIVLDPFESIYRPATRMRTSDRIKNQDTAIPSTLPTAPESPTPVIEPNVQGATSTQSVQFPVDLKELSQSFEIDLIKQALADSQYNQKKTAERLSLTYHQLRGYLKKYNLLDTPPEDRE